MNKLIAQGAEGKIYQINSTTLKKIRDKKPYRLEIIDNKLRKFRCKREFKVLNILHENKINVPKPIELIEDKENQEFSFTFEYINGKNLKEVINKQLLFETFNQIIKIHKQKITHGDLTTLNILVKENKPYIIDFGLSNITHRTEDRAVDLNLFFTSIKNEHQQLHKYKQELINKYLKEEFGKKVIDRLEKIEQRGRNK